MIKPDLFYKTLKRNGVNFFTGVPDSILKGFNNYLVKNASKNEHIIAANEGGAVALASGYHLATDKVALVYMQNSGLGNAINPLMSLADKDVYGIPMILLIGWRGEPGKKDEPQHMKQGRITIPMLKTMQIPNVILSDSSKQAEKQIFKAIEISKKQGMPYALIARRGLFSGLDNKIDSKKYKLSREEVLREIITLTDVKDILISTTGKTSRELYELQKEMNFKNPFFLNVGAMGHVSQIALGVALAKPKTRVICLDGDGSFIMHMGSLAINSKFASKNLIHVVLNNECHESVGGQPTSSDTVNFSKLVKACGYKNLFLIKNRTEISKLFGALNKIIGPVFVEVKINPGSRTNLGRPENFKKLRENFLL
jgi:phosphonopyruvate decarboxylase